MERFDQKWKLGLGVATVLAVLSGGMQPENWAAQSTSRQDGQDLDAVLDPYQRSGQILYNRQFGERGWQRGEQIYYLSCWICHNDYTIKEDSNPAPTLKGLFSRPQLMSGEAVNDRTVAEKIRQGGPRMPAYQLSFSDADMTDLIDYLRDHCCWDEDNPRSNPAFKADHESH